MDTYRIEVGRDHGVQVKNIVGAIANEADISSKFIGEIRLFNEHSTVQLPQNMPSDVLSHFKSVHICQRPMNMTKSTHPPTKVKAEAKSKETVSVALKTHVVAVVINAVLKVKEEKNAKEKKLAFLNRSS